MNQPTKRAVLALPDFAIRTLNSPTDLRLANLVGTRFAILGLCFQEGHAHEVLTHRMTADLIGRSIHMKQGTGGKAVKSSCGVLPVFLLPTWRSFLEPINRYRYRVWAEEYDVKGQELAWSYARPEQLLPGLRGVNHTPFDEHTPFDVNMNEAANVLVNSSTRQVHAVFSGAYDPKRHDPSIRDALKSIGID